MYISVWAWAHVQQYPTQVFLQVCLSPKAGSKAERVPADQIKTDESKSLASLFAVALNIYMQHVCLHWGQTVLYVQATVSTLNNLTALSNKRADTLTQGSARLIPLHQKLIGRLDPRTTHTHTEQVKTEAYTPVPVLADTATELPTNL